MNIKENKPALPKYAQCFKLAEKFNFQGGVGMAGLSENKANPASI